MTREQLKTLGALHDRRDRMKARLESLAKESGADVVATVKLSGCYETVPITKAFISAQWTAQLIDIERRIRAAGGTL